MFLSIKRDELDFQQHYGSVSNVFFLHRVRNKKCLNFTHIIHDIEAQTPPGLGSGQGRHAF